MTATKEEKDIIEIKNEIERIRHHLDLQKTDHESASTQISYKYINRAFALVFIFRRHQTSHLR